MEPKNDKRTTYPSGALRSDRAGKGRYDLVSPHGLKRLAIQYEEGGIQKGERNWEQGFPISRALCSAIGHLMDHLAGDRSEDHLAAAAWQEFCAMHFEVLIEQGKLPVELNDVPFDPTTLPADTGDVEATERVMALNRIPNVIAKVVIPAGAHIESDVETLFTIVNGMKPGVVVNIDGKFVLRLVEDT